MRKLIALAFLVSATMLGQFTIGSRSFAPISAGTPTFTYVQSGHCAITSNTATSCSVAMSSGALTAGNLYVVMSNAYAGTEVSITSVVAGSETYTTGSSLTTAVGCSTGASAYSPAQWCSYVLPSASLGGTSPLTINFSAAPTNGSQVYVQEWHPTSSPSTVGLDTDSAYYQPTDSTTSVGPAFTYSSTNDVTTTGWYAADSYTNPTSVSAPYSTYSYINSFGQAGALSQAQPTWTSPSTAALTYGMSFGFSPAAFSEGSFIDFEGGTNAAAPTVATLMASTHGWQGANWDVSHVDLMKYATAANMPLANSTGRLSDGSSYAAGAGTLGVGITFDGTDDLDYIQYYWGLENSEGSLASPVVSVGVWYYGDQTATDQSDIDCVTLHGSYDFAAVNCYGSGTNRYFGLETAGGNGASVITETPGVWYWLLLTYNTTGSHTLTVYDCSSGTAPSCTLQNLGTLTHVSEGDADYPRVVQIGDEQGSNKPTSGTHSYWDSVKLSLTGATLLP